MPLARGRSVRFGGLLHRDSIEAAPSGAASAYVRRTEPVTGRSARYDGRVKVSVIVPVYNPGRDIDRCIASVLDQSLPTTEYEAIFIDDGSTDETPERLDRLAAEHAHIRVIHIPNSGWPGKPRNVGVEQATGTFVQFVDQDDHLSREALERLVAMGDANGSDIVIGKVTSDFRGVPHGLFRKDRPACTIWDTSLIDSLTPHKMFRRSFLLAHGIRFPEGPYILEDQLFMVRSYFRAKVVSILASYPCYFYNVRTEGTNTASRRMDPPTYYRNLRDVIEVVLANTEPGDVRDRLLRRSYRVEMLGRLGEPWFPRQEPEFRTVLFRAIRELAMDHMNEAVHAGLSPLMRLRSTLLRADRPDELAALATRATTIEATVDLERLAWSNGRLEIAFRAGCTDASRGVPIRLVRRGDRTYLDPYLTEGILGAPFDVTDDLGSFRTEVSLRNVEDHVEWRLNDKRSVEFIDDGTDADGATRLRPVIHVTAAIDPQTVAGGGPIGDGTWEIRTRVTFLGIDRRVTLAPSKGQALPPIAPGWLGRPARQVRPTADPDLGIRLEIGPGSLTDLAAAGSPEPAPSGGRASLVGLPVASAPGWTVPIMATVRPSADATTTGARTRGRPVRARLIDHGGLVHVEVRWPLFGIGRWPVTLTARLDGPDGPLTTLGTARTGRDGRTFLDGAARVGIWSTVGHYLREGARSVWRRGPHKARMLVRRAARTVRRRVAP